MNRLEVIKQKLIDPPLDTPDIHALEKASAILRSVAEAEKIESDIAASTRIAHSESLRFWIPILAPVISALALIGTLLFQMQQYNENAKTQRAVDEKNAQAQRLANEDAQWRDVLTLAKGTEGPARSYAVTLIQSFFDSDRYKKDAREITVVLLAGTADPNVFNDGFAALLERTDWDNFKHLKNLSRAQSAYFYKYKRDAARFDDQQKQSKMGVPILSDDPNFMLNASGTNVVTTSKGLVQFLRKSLNSRPANIELDLNGCAIWEQNVSNMDFSQANLEMLDVDSSDLSGGNFTGQTYLGHTLINPISPTLISVILMLGMLFSVVRRLIIASGKEQRGGVPRELVLNSLTTCRTIINFPKVWTIAMTRQKIFLSINRRLSALPSSIAPRLGNSGLQCKARAYKISEATLSSASLARSHRKEVG